MPEELMQLLNLVYLGAPVSKRKNKPPVIMHGGLEYPLAEPGFKQWGEMGIIHRPDRRYPTLWSATPQFKENWKPVYEAQKNVEKALSAFDKTLVPDVPEEEKQA